MNENKINSVNLSLVLICRRPNWDTAWDNAAAYVNIYRRHNLSQALTAGLPAKKIFYVNIICGDLRRYAATKLQVGQRHMRTRLLRK